MERSAFRLVSGLLLVLGAAPCCADWITLGAPYIDHPDYDYGVSVIQEGNLRHVWWCGYGSTAHPANTGQRTDVIFHATHDLGTGQWTPAVEVLWPDPPRWDGRYTCDPSVIGGVFRNPDDGRFYRYAMYYTATDTTVNNRIGVAFSHDGIQWTKYSRNPVISPQAAAQDNYGAGQAATFLGGEGCSTPLYLVHGDASVPGVYVRKSYDAVTFGAPTRVSETGAHPFSDSDFAFDATQDVVYGALQGGELPNGGGRFDLYRMPGAAFRAGTGTLGVARRRRSEPHRLPAQRQHRVPARPERQAGALATERRHLLHRKGSRLGPHLGGVAATA